MSETTHTILVLLLLSNFGLFGSNRLLSLVSFVTLQGLLLSALTLSAHYPLGGFRTIFLAVALFVVEGILVPFVLRRAAAGAPFLEDPPIVGYSLSLFSGAMIILLSFFFLSSVGYPTHGASREFLPYAFATMLSGLFLIVTRRSAMTQVIGYLVLSNGVFLAGSALAIEQPLLLELGILLDAFLAVVILSAGMTHGTGVFQSVDTSNSAPIAREP
ncbi:MAG: hypothetical protein IT290_06540 [Deltaproteobacteria bacterium]|nr:hypothetical protein [Deltaproteobacteria bacterium]